MLDEAILQPYVHDCVMNVSEGRHTYNFCIFFKRHCRLKANNLLMKKLRSGGVFRGDVLVMRLGTRFGYVNMGGRDNIVSDWAVRR